VLRSTVVRPVRMDLRAHRNEIIEDPQMGPADGFTRCFRAAVQTLHDAPRASRGEAALDSIAKLLGMPWPLLR